MKDQPQITDRDDATLALIESSRLWRALVAWGPSMSAAANTSYVAGQVRCARAYWLALNWCARRRAVAIMLIVAAATHIALNAALGRPVGLLWLAIPLAAIVWGAMLFFVSSPPRRSEAAI